MDRFVCFENHESGIDELGNKYICIDGYPADENGFGAVVAEVFLTPHRDFVVAWHDNGYRFNKLVLEAIEDSKTRLLNW